MSHASRASGSTASAHRCSSVVLVAAVAGVLFAARLGTARGDLANGFELEVITIVLLGGVSIFGGSGRLSGVALAILIVLNIRNGLGLAGVDGTTQTGVIGVILIASVLVQNVLVRIQPRDTRRSPPPSPQPAIDARDATSSKQHTNHRKGEEPT